jgi:hypothetical protein
MIDFLLGVTFGIFLWLWLKETATVTGSPKKQIAYVVGLLLSIILAWLL